MPAETRSFRKIFKFPVSNPLSMRSVKVYTFQESFFVHLELQNLTEHPMYVESVKLDPSFGYSMIDHSTHNSGASYDHLMMKNEVRRMLFQLAPKEKSKVVQPATPNKQQSNAAAALGKIELLWRTPMGESGQLVTNQINHKALPKPDIELEFLGLKKDFIFVQEPFEIACKVWNRSQQELELQVQFNSEKMFPLAVHGRSFYNLSKIEPGGSKAFSLVLFAVQPGIQAFGGGIVIKQVGAEKQWAVGELTQIVVLNANAKSLKSVSATPAEVADDDAAAAE